MYRHQQTPPTSLNFKGILNCPDFNNNNALSTLEQQQATNAIDNLLNEQTQGLHFKKLTHYDDVYTIRTSQSGRLIFLERQYHGETYLVYIDFDKNHDQINKKPISKSKMKAIHGQCNTLSEKAILGKFLINKNYKHPKSTASNNNNTPSEAQKTVQRRYVDTKTITLSQAQSELLKRSIRYPTAVMGMPGSGKTLVCLEKIKQTWAETKEPILCITQSKQLCDNMAMQLSQMDKQLPSSDMLRDPKSQSPIHFLTVKECFQPIVEEFYQKEQLQEADFTEFTAWAQQNKAVAELFDVKPTQLTNTHVERLYRECQNICVQPSEKDYLQHFKKESLFDKDEKKKKAYSLFETYQKHLKDTKRIDLTLTLLSQEQLTKLLPAIFMLEEFQDNPPAVLRHLIMAAQHGIWLFGDPLQALNNPLAASGFVSRTLKEQDAHQYRVIQLTEIFRSPQKVLEVSNTVLSMLNFLMGGTLDEYSYLQVKGAPSFLENLGKVSYDTPSESTKQRLRTLASNPQTIILVMDEHDKAKAIEELGFEKTDHYLILTVEEFKGLESAHVIAYRPFTSVDALKDANALFETFNPSDPLRLNQPKTDDFRRWLYLKTTFHKILTLFTRVAAHGTLHIYEESKSHHPLRHLIRPIQEHIEAQTSEAKTEETPPQLSSEQQRKEWAEIFLYTLNETNQDAVLKRAREMFGEETTRETLEHIAGILPIAPSALATAPNPTVTEKPNENRQPSKPKAKKKGKKPKKKKPSQKPKTPKSANEPKSEEVKSTSILVDALKKDNLSRKEQTQLYSKYPHPKWCMTDEELFAPKKQYGNILHIALNGAFPNLLNCILSTIEKNPPLIKKAMAGKNAYIELHAPKIPTYTLHYLNYYQTIEFEQFEKILALFPTLINQTNNERKTILLEAIEHGHETVVNQILKTAKSHQILKECIEPPLAFDTPIFTALQCYLKHREKWHQRIIWTLSQEGAPLSVSKEPNRTLLHVATEQSTLQDVQWIHSLDQQSSIIHCMNEQGDTPLTMACCLKKWDIAKYLITKGALITHKNNEGKTPLYYAIEAQHPTTIQLLINEGYRIFPDDMVIRILKPAHLNAINPKSQRTFFEENRDYFSSNDASWKSKCLIKAIEFENEACVEFLFQQGADIPQDRIVSLALETTSPFISGILRSLPTFDPNRPSLHNNHPPIVEVCSESNLTKMIWLLHTGAKANNMHLLHLLIKHWNNIHSSTDTKKALRALCKAGGDLNEKDSEGKTPLHCAFDEGYDSNILNALLYLKANIHLQDNKGLSPLAYALNHPEKSSALPIIRQFHGETQGFSFSTSIWLKLLDGMHTECILSYLNLGIECPKTFIERLIVRAVQMDSLLLLQKIASIRKERLAHSSVTERIKTKHQHLSPNERLRQWCKYNQVKLIQEELENPININDRPMGGDTALHIALQWNSYAAAETLLNHTPININIPDSKGRTPLMLALENGFFCLAEKLLNMEADTSLMMANQPWINDMKRRLEEADCTGRYPIHNACHQNCFQVVKFMIDLGMSVNQTDAQNQTPLFFTDDHFELTELLVENKANIHQRSRDGYTPLCNTFNLAVIELLLENKADINAQCNQGNTLLHLAAQNDEEEVIQLLLDHGARFDIKNHAHFNALEEVCYLGNHESFYAMTQVKKPIKALDINIRLFPMTVRPLEYGIHNQIVECLGNKAKGFDETDDKGRTPAHRFAKHGSPEMLSIVVQQYPKAIHIRDKKGRRPIDLAYGHAENRHLLFQKEQQVKPINEPNPPQKPK